MVIGGQTVYAALLPHAHRLYLTYVEATFAGDTYFPAIDPEEWRVVSEKAHLPDEKNPYPYRFVILERRAPAP
jgi:dihydrofolate reductase